MIDVRGWRDEAWRLNCHLLGLAPWDFARIETVEEFQDMITGALHRYQLAQDLFGHLRLDILNVNGATFFDRPQPRKEPLKPGERVPTFETLLGRRPVDVLGRHPEEVAAAAEPPGLPESLKGLTLEERMAKARRAQANVAAVQARKALKQTAKMG